MSKPNAAHGGAGWTSRSSDVRAEIGTQWQSFGQNSEYAQLKKVLLIPPSRCVSEITDPVAALWDAPMDLDRATSEFECLIDVYKNLGIEVYTPPPDYFDTPNAHFARDMFTMTPAGAVVGRLASPVRAGEETAMIRTLLDLRVPLLGLASAPSIFEGPDLVFFEPDRAFVGIGLRSNKEGALQVSSLLASVGIEATIVETTFGCGHLDGVLSIVDQRMAVLRGRRASFRIYETLRNLGYEILVFDDDQEADAFMAINMVAIDRRTVVMPAGARSCIEQLRTAGVWVIEVEMPELMKSGGAVHCMTGVIERELI